jgi:hypothetical protein
VSRLTQPQEPYIVRAPARSDSGDEETYIRARQLESSRLNQQFLLLLADRGVVTLSDELVGRLGAITNARVIMISAKTRRHIRERRALVSQRDADLAADRIHEALEDCHFLIMPQTKQNIYAVIGYASSADRRILVVLKLVPAARSATKQDEWWVQTAHPFGVRNFRRAMESGNLRPLQ